jgi:hypothetical protein
MKLDEEVFSRSKFIEYASQNLVLVQLDYPRKKEQPSDVKKANRALARKYGVSGYPTVLIIKPDGTELWEQRGYAPGGPDAMIAAANQCRKAAGLAASAQPLVAAAAAPTPPASAPVTAAPIPQPVAPPQPRSHEPKLQGILFSPSNSSVVLNGRTCEEGDSVRGVRVLKITRDEVTVEIEGQTKVLRMQ